MQNEQHQLQNKIHSERLIRRWIKAAGHTISTDQEAKLVEVACREAAEESASWEHRKQRIEMVIRDYLAGKIDLDEAPEEKVVEEIAPEVEAPPLPEGQTPLTDLDLTPGVLASLEAKGMVTLEQVAAYAASGGDFLEINGIGVATAAKLKALLTVEPEEDLDPEDEELDAE